MIWIYKYVVVRCSPGVKYMIANDPWLGDNSARVFEDPVTLSGNLNNVLTKYKTRKFNIPNEPKYWCLSGHMKALKVCKGSTRKQAVKKAAKAVLKRALSEATTWSGDAIKSVEFSIMQVSNDPVSDFETIRTYEITLEEVEARSEAQDKKYYKSYIRRLRQNVLSF